MIIDFHIDNELAMRMERRVNLDFLHCALGVDYVIAGGSLRAETPNDFDVYSASDDHPFDLEKIREKLIGEAWEYVMRTANALTLRDPSGRTFQFCTYAKPTPRQLIESFDFSHCQVGIVVRKKHDSSGVETEAVFTPEYVKWTTLQTTRFTGSEYPISSLCRLPKYVKRGLLSSRESTHAVIDILTTILTRGFRDYDDFKDQLDAIDLAYSEDNAIALWHVVRDKLCSEKKT